MKKALLIIICFFATATPLIASDSKDALNVYKEYLSATEKKNLGIVMSLLDKTSPNYANEVKAVAESMINTSLSYKIISAKPIGKSDDILVLRITQQNIPIATPTEGAKGIEIDALQIFKKNEDGKWKFRSSVILAAKTLE